MKLKSTLLLLLFAAATFSPACSLFKKEEEDNTNQLAALLLLAIAATPCLSSTSTGSTVTNSSATLSNGCVSGVTTSMDSSLPSWIKDNFSCSVGYTSGNYYCFKSKNLPNHASYYWGSGSPLYAALPTLDDGSGAAQHTAAGTNRIASQNFTYAIPKTPSRGSGTVSTQGGLTSIGITRNGLAIFNNAAAPPDNLSVEALTFDGFGAHPNNTSITHHHAWVLKYSTNGGTTVSNYNVDSNLIGIALDGYAIYGLNCPSTGAAATGLDSLHGHTTTTNEFTTATYHYHYSLDSTATIRTLMGSYFYGNIGSVTN